MDDWSKPFFEMLETAAKDVENFVTEVSEEVTEIIEILVDISEEFTEQLHYTIFTEIDRHLNEFVEPFLDDIDEDFVERGEETPSHFITYIDATPEKNPACMGCQHYHGYIYGGNLLVCGMHPYGWETDNCPDWQESEN